MDTPTELELRSLLFGGILVMLVLAITLIVFFVLYQKKYIAQQMYLLQIQSEHQRKLLISSIEAQEKERERIARDLHDEIGSALSTAKLFVGQLQMGEPDPEKRQLSSQVRDILTSTLQEVRNISHDLMPDVLRKFGLAEALQHLVDVVAEASSLEVHFQRKAQPQLPYQHELALYRIVQELTHNALRHANATRLTLRLWQEEHVLHALVEDDGRGFDWQSLHTSKEAGIGLKSIEARVSMLAGTLHVDTAPGQGTRIRIAIDLQPSLTAHSLPDHE
jgi:signal transduction histidine kinase